MKKTKNVLLLFCCSLILISCQKELSMDSSLGPGGSTSLNGNWKFVGMHVKTEAVIELNDGIDILKTMTISDYDTKQNTGTIRIDDTKLTSTNFGYEIDTHAKAWIYENGILTDSLLFPFNFIVPPSGASSTYTKVSADSIYFNGGQFAGIAGTPPSADPTGVKLQFLDDKMLMTIKASDTEVQESSGLRQTKAESVHVVMTYQRL